MQRVDLALRGSKPLTGRVEVGGSARAAMAHTAALLLATEPVHLENVPWVCDVVTQVELVSSLGVDIDRAGQDLLATPASDVAFELTAHNHPSFRPALLLTGPLLARTGRATVPLPGSSEAGPYSLELHTKGLAAMGVAIQVEAGRLVLTTDRLQGADIFLDYPSVSATLNLMLAATGASGRTIIRHAAREPEVVDLASLLLAMGARVRGAGTDVIAIEGGEPLQGARHTVIGDRHAAALYLAAGLATGGDVEVAGIEPEHLIAVAAKCEELGARIAAKEAAVRVAAPRALRAAVIRALPYPGFPSDVQPLVIPALSQAEGTSLISDGSLADRFHCVEEMRRLGIRAEAAGGTVVVHGERRLTGARVQATGPSDASALLIAALAAEGESVVERADSLWRRFQGPVAQLLQLGADIKVVHGSLPEFVGEER